MTVKAPRVGMISLGCPKDAEYILPDPPTGLPATANDWIRVSSIIPPSALF